MSTKQPNQNYFFILGGEDNEMAHIKQILERELILYWQPQQEWGTIKVEWDTLPTEAKDKHLVFVECRPGWGSKMRMFQKNGRTWKLETGNFRATLIDHHGPLADRPASLLQVLKLLGKRPTLRQQLVASIDSNFLAPTIKRWPQQKQKIIQIWENGYRKSFSSVDVYEQFKQQCRELFEEAKKNMQDNLIVIDKAPNSMTMLGAMANIEGLACCLIVGSRDSASFHPCFYQGSPEIVERLIKQSFTKSYWGKYYFGCRAIPQKFINCIQKKY